jgi:hypothetical protein
MSYNLNRPALIVKPDTLDELYEKAFYGLKFSPLEGRLTVETIKEDEPVVLPESTSYKTEEYVTWFASAKNLNFKWKEYIKASHLYLEVG